MVINKIFPHLKTYQEKAFEFLKVCYANGWSYRATGKALGINHVSVKKLLEELKGTDIYAQFLAHIEDEIKDFYDPAFKVTIYQRYEKMLKEAYKEYQKAKLSAKEKDRIEWFKVILSIHRDMLQASLTADKTRLKSSKEEAKEKFADLYKEAMEEYAN